MESPPSSPDGTKGRHRTTKGNASEQAYVARIMRKGRERRNASF
jgi:hypothetical protein